MSNRYMLIRGAGGRTEVWEYIDNVEEARTYWYVNDAIDKYGVESMMPIVMNKLGGYHTHKPDADDVIGIIESEGWPTLKVWEEYPMNAPDFKTGWISPEGNTFKCTIYEHLDCSEAIATQFYGKHTKTISDSLLLKFGWFKCSNKKYSGYHHKMSDKQAQFFLDNNFVSELDVAEVCVNDTIVQSRRVCNQYENS